MRGARIALVALAIGALAACSGAVREPASDNGQQAKIAAFRSTSIALPEDDQTFGESAAVAPLNAHCLACHSTSMILYQPQLSKAQWQAIVDKMRDAYGAPVPADQSPAIVDALVALQTKHADGR